jgi:hypothetical protein
VIWPKPYRIGFGRIAQVDCTVGPANTLRALPTRARA